jgi:hypothetical protein
MTNQMTVLFVKHTGHVLAAVTRNADPSSQITAEDLARGGLLVRGFAVNLPTTTGNEQFNVMPEELGVITLNFNRTILLKPRTFSIADEQPVQTPTAPVLSLALTTGSVEVSLGTAPTDRVTKETNVWVQIDGGNLDEPRTEQGAIAVNQSSATLQLDPLDTGRTYYVLALVAGREPFVTSVSL